MGTLAGKRALVTAGAQGIGLAISQALLREGCHVAAHYYTSGDGAEALRAEAGEAGARVGAFQADLTDAAAAGELVERAVEFLGGLDILINNAGGLVARRLVEALDPEFWRRVQELNMASMVQVTRAALPALTAAGQSSIVNNASLAGRTGGHPGSLAYASSKGAVLAFTRALSREVAGRGIRVNAVAPGLILGTSFHANHTTAESARRTIENIPLGRAGEPDDVARAVVFLASEYDGFITGATLDINGGSYCA
jgi:3-oxoacyl-[acyl-carrier protein] reductase